jgi:hypothetical protein
MTQTAVEFLEKEIKEIISYLKEDGMYAMKGAEERLFGECNIFHKALEMENKQQGYSEKEVLDIVDYCDGSHIKAKRWLEQS